MSGRKHIAFDARYVSDRYHGIGRYAFQLLDKTTAAAPDLTWVVFTGKAPDSRFDWAALEGRANVEFRDGPWPLFLPHEQLLWPLLLRRNRIDLFHSPYFVAPLAAPCPVLITIHDLIFEHYPQYMPQKWALPYYRLLTHASCWRASLTLTVSEATARDLDGPPYHVPRSKIHVIPNAIDEEWPGVVGDGLVEGVRAKYHLSRPFVLAVGARRPHKNYGALVRAFSHLVSSVPHDLVFVGPSDERFPDEAAAVVEECGLRERVRFPDWVSEEELAALYQLADVVAIPSIIEGFGLPALEAMAAGKAVLVSNCSSLPEVVGESGVQVDPRDEMDIAEGLRKLLNDPVLRARLEDSGREQAARFTWDDSARKMIAIYREILA